MSMAAPSHAHVHEVERVERMETSSSPHPVENDEVEEVNEEDFYKTVMEQAAKAPVQHESVQGVKVEANYESMTLKELKDEAKRKGIKVSANAPKKDVIDALKRQGQASVLEPVPGDGALEEGFPVELTN